MHGVMRVLPGPLTDAPIALVDLPRRAVAIRDMRADLLEQFALDHEAGRQGLYWWYYLHGFREMGLVLDPTEDLKGPLNQPVPGLRIKSAIPITQLMRRMWLAGQVPHSMRADWVSRRGWRVRVRRWFKHVPYEPRSAAEQDRLVAWYFCSGLAQFGLLDTLSDDQANALTTSLDRPAEVPLLIALIWRSSDELRQRFGSLDSPAFAEWCRDAASSDFPILRHRAIVAKLPQRFRPLGKTSARPFRPRALGVNLIGHVHARSGVGEDVRMAAAALTAATIPFVLRNVEPSQAMGAGEALAPGQISHQSPHDINIFCMSGMETVSVLGRHPDLASDKYNIGFWPWELPRWPELWAHAPGLMDELWASTRFTAEAYRSSVAVPVELMPMAVEVAHTEGLDRDSFGLPQDRFLFAFAFDGHSSFARKNPQGCLAAFLRAFPAGNEPAGLVLKGLRVGGHPDWDELQAMAAIDPRIVLLTESMSRGALLDLYRSIDCFVSLHRSEGFGRNLAECMLLGKPVIGTNYSGNRDFMTAETAGLVPADLCKVAPGAYPFGNGQLWAEPSVDQAAALMRRVFDNQAWRQQVAKAGQLLIQTRHSPAAIGENFLRRLRRVADLRIEKE